MTNTGDEQKQPSALSTLSQNPPPLTSSSRGENLPSTQRLTPRKVTSAAPEFQVTDTAEFTPEGYVGQGLVDSKGVIRRGQYDEGEAYAELTKMTAGERRAFLNRFAALGLYGNSKPSLSGFEDRDLSVVREAMRVANAEGYTLDVTQSILATKYPKAEGTGRRIRTSPKADLRAVFKRTAGELLGRQLSDTEVERFVKAYTGMEVTEQKGGAVAPSAQVAAEGQIMRRQGTEAAAVGALQLAKIMEQKIKALG
jgi:hypothetical protein